MKNIASMTVCMTSFKRRKNNIFSESLIATEIVNIHLKEMVLWGTCI